MALPYFFKDDISGDRLQLDEDTSKHVIQVLRMEKGERILLTDGKGRKAETEIVDDNRKRCLVHVVSLHTEAPQEKKVAIALSLLKNTVRFEWFLEKATELGVSEIIPLMCERTEKEKFRQERLESIIVSAMLQSQQCWKPVLHQPTNFEAVLSNACPQKWIAHCLPHERVELSQQLLAGSKNDTAQNERLILIGPEGDFTNSEIEAALSNGFKPASLGPTRLRTETAGVVAACLLRLC